MHLKNEQERLNCLECIQLLHTCVENKMIQQDPQNANNIIVYRTADALNPEGWYTMNLISCAANLAGDLNGQLVIRQALAEKQMNDRNTFYWEENRRIINEYPEQIDKVLNYAQCELDREFLGFLHVYEDLKIPKDFTIIDFGCNQAVQALYFDKNAAYIGIDNGVPNSARFEQDNAVYYECSIQEFIRDILPKLSKQGLDINKVFALCSYVPDEEAQKMVAETFPFHKVVYCEQVISEKLPLTDVHNKRDTMYER